MTAERIVECLLDDRLACLEALVRKASVHLPPRGTKWVAAFADETGKQVWKVDKRVGDVSWSSMVVSGDRLYVQPGHYLCLGDNSTASSDSRDSIG